MDHTEKLEMTKPKGFKPSFEFKYLKPGSAGVILTPDDILTLRLLRCSLQPNPHRSGEEDKYLDTLNRILKQVE